MATHSPTTSRGNMNYSRKKRRTMSHLDPLQLSEFILSTPALTSPKLARLVLNNHVDSDTLATSPTDVLRSVVGDDQNATEDLLMIQSLLSTGVTRTIHSPPRSVLDIARQLEKLPTTGNLPPPTLTEENTDVESSASNDIFIPEWDFSDEHDGILDEIAEVYGMSSAREEQVLDVMDDAPLIQFDDELSSMASNFCHPDFSAFASTVAPSGSYEALNTGLNTGSYLEDLATINMSAKTNPGQTSVVAHLQHAEAPQQSTNDPHSTHYTADGEAQPSAVSMSGTGTGNKDSQPGNASLSKKGKARKKKRGVRRILVDASTQSLAISV